MDGHTYRCTDGHTEEHIDGWMDKQTDTGEKHYPLPSNNFIWMSYHTHFTFLGGV